MENFDKVTLTEVANLEVINDMIDSQLQFKELESDENIEISFLEKLIFADHERFYSELNPRAARQVIKALIKIDGTVECENCNVSFTEEEFQSHACLYDEFNQLNTVQEEKPPETELQQLQRRSLDVMKDNLGRIRETVGTKDIQSEIECSKCCRRFVHENGLYRHWDMHIGELLDVSPPEDSSVLGRVALCVFCGEVFGDNSDAWDHLVEYHVHIDGGSTEISDANAGNEISKELGRIDSGISGFHDGSTENENFFQINGISEKVADKEVSDDPPATTNTPESIKTPASRNLEVSEFIRMISVTKLFQCELCDSIFSNGRSMLFHVSNHALPSGFQCNTCEISDLPLKDFLLHRRDECVIYRDIRNPFRNFPRVFVCNVCDMEFLGLEQLLEHRYEAIHLFPRMDIQTAQLGFLCERCLESFPTAPKLVDHFQEKHKKKPKNNEIAETSERIPKPASMQRGGSHQTSTRPRQFLCEVCGKSYTQSSHLWQHLRFHQGVKPFECNVDGCNRKFTIRPDLNDHIRKCHTGERPYLCTICGKRFLTGSVYYQHRLIHRGERRYGCEECGKRFYRADALKNHLRIHSGEKPHSCPVCHKTFRQRGDRDKHMKARHPEAEAVNSPKKKRIKSFGRGRIKNNTSLYRSKPAEGQQLAD